MGLIIWNWFYINLTNFKLILNLKTERWFKWFALLIFELTIPNYISIYTSWCDQSNGHNLLAFTMFFQISINSKIYPFCIFHPYPLKFKFKSSNISGKIWCKKYKEWGGEHLQQLKLNPSWPILLILLFTAKMIENGALDICLKGMLMGNGDGRW